jgi:hypothetical protein
MASLFETEVVEVVVHTFNFCVCARGIPAGNFDARTWTMLSETNSTYFSSANAHWLFDQGADIFIFPI